MSIFKTIGAALLTALFAFRAYAADVTVFAAASLSDALTEIGKNYEAKTGQHVVFSFAASSALARQIEASKGADIFVSADTDWMDELDNKGLIAKDTRKNLLGNSLVLISPADLNVTLKIAPHFALAKALGNGRLAIAEPNSVPAGKYAKAALTTLGVWSDVADHTAPAENVRAALAYVARGEAQFGIVYRTDALAEKKVRIVDTFPESSHAPIVYPAALTKDTNANARGFLDYMESADARTVFEKDGFTVLN
jgi:molybdate transport system substrate-binding protein